MHMSSRPSSHLYECKPTKLDNAGPRPRIDLPLDDLSAAKGEAQRLVSVVACAIIEDALVSPSRSYVQELCQWVAGSRTGIELLAVGSKGSLVVNLNDISLLRLAITFDFESLLNLQLVGRNGTDSGRGDQGQSEEEAHRDEWRAKTGLRK
jgi:hypothetical protein